MANAGRLPVPFGIPTPGMCTANGATPAYDLKAGVCLISQQQSRNSEGTPAPRGAFTIRFAHPLQWARASYRSGARIARRDAQLAHFCAPCCAAVTRTESAARLRSFPATALVTLRRRLDRRSRLGTAPTCCRAAGIARARGASRVAPGRAGSVLAADRFDTALAARKLGKRAAARGQPPSECEPCGNRVSPKQSVSKPCDKVCDELRGVGKRFEPGGRAVCRLD
jgi:hypothetical protein